MLDETNTELGPRGLYVTHIWGPEQQILTPAWRDNCRPIRRPAGLRWLRATARSPVDLIVSKLCRADDRDLADIQYLIAHERLTAAEVLRALDTAMVPADFVAIYPENRAKVERLVGAGAS